MYCLNDSKSIYVKMKPKNNMSYFNENVHGISTSYAKQHHSFTTEEGLKILLKWVQKRNINSKQVILIGHKVNTEHKALHSVKIDETDQMKNWIFLDTLKNRYIILFRRVKQVKAKFRFQLIILVLD